MEDSLAEQPRFSYGGQAVIEGVMIRGRNHFSLAVRRQDGTIEHHSEVLNSLYTGRMRQFPLIRGFIALVETMVLGIKALHLSANMAVKDQGGEEGEAAGFHEREHVAVSLSGGSEVGQVQEGKEASTSGV